MDQAELVNQIHAHKQTTRTLGCMLMILILFFLVLVSGGGYFLYKQSLSSQLAENRRHETALPNAEQADGGDNNEVTDTSPHDNRPSAEPRRPAGDETSTRPGDDGDDIDDFIDEGDIDGADTHHPTVKPPPMQPPATKPVMPTKPPGPVKPSVKPFVKPTPSSRTMSFKIVTKPASAKVFLGKKGRYLGKTPLTVELPPGEQVLTYVLPGYKKTRQKVRVGKQKKTWALLPPVSPTRPKRTTRPRKPSPVKAPPVQASAGTPEGMVYVPGGYFLRGASSGPEDARPKKKIFLSPFYIDRHEVTVAEYRRFLIAVRAGKASGVFHPNDDPARDRSPRKPYGKLPARYFTDPVYNDYPVVNVDWFDAYAYCRWVGKRLPTEAEWEKAGRGPTSSVFPWGMKTRGAEANWGSADGAGSVAPVMTKPKDKSGFGCLDMAGNVREWCYDYYGKTYYANSPRKNPKGPTKGTLKVIKGGSWMSRGREPLYHRSFNARRVKLSDVGFRCARTAR